jgi:hypothetical protein
VKARLRELALTLIAAAVVARVGWPPFRQAQVLASAPYAELPVPPAWLYSGALFLAAASVLLAVVLFLRKVDATHFGYRLTAIVAVTLVFVRYVVLGSFADPGGASGAAVQALVRFGQAILASRKDPLPSSVADLTFASKDLGQPPYLARGHRVEKFDVVLRTECTGPVFDPGTFAPGTIFYCLSADLRHAWSTTVGLNGPTGSPIILRIPFSTEPAVFPIDAQSPAAPAPAGQDGG